LFDNLVIFKSKFSQKCSVSIVRGTKLNENLSRVNSSNCLMAELDLLVDIALIAGESALVAMTILIWKEIVHIDEVFKFTKLQSQPWVGPSDGNILSDPNPPLGKEKFIIKLKNFGKTPAKNVTIHFISQNKKLSKSSLQESNVNKFSLGPMLPNMEKSYWFYLDSDEMQKARKNAAQVFIGIYISYEFSGGKNGYGLISHFDSYEDGFVKTEMWED